MNKLCRKCDTTKPLSEFHRNRRVDDGLQAYCKACMIASTKAYYKTDRGKAAIMKGVQKKIDAGYYRHGKGAISIMKTGAKKRGIEFRLDAESLEQWWHSTPDLCSYCGISIEDYLTLRDEILAYEGGDFGIIKFTRFYRSPKHKAIRWMTIDRVENDIGYLLSNIVKSCWICNSLKSDFFTGSQMRSIGPEVIGKLVSLLGLPIRLGVSQQDFSGSKPLQTDDT